ncbi:hypothetical protein P5673_022346 [Acropora cervicornis]|uniref:Uncharacterized protein n=1 Tax=Acropora cervicornis TaxID=6130 RepID=A0AAD9Q6R9_ACRCE|nr:hypothetical protein P5673_022346 [Acropora cervicornis]
MRLSQILKSRYFYSVLFKTIKIFSCNLEILYGIGRATKAVILEAQQTFKSALSSTRLPLHF